MTARAGTDKWGSAAPAAPSRTDKWGALAPATTAAAPRREDAVTRTRAIERELEEAKQIGAATLATLAEQGETLETAHRKALVVESQAAHGESIVRSMDSWWSRAYYTIFGAPQVKSEAQAAAEAAAAVKGAPGRGASATAAGGAGGGAAAAGSASAGVAAAAGTAPAGASAAASGAARSSTTAAAPPTTATLLADDAAVNASLSGMSSTLGELRGMARGMGDALEEHSARATAITKTVDRTERHFAVVQDKISYLKA